MKALSLFSGIGGIDLACEWAGIETVAFCERDPFPQKVLRKHWPNVPIYDDVRTLTKERLEQDAVIIRRRSIDLIHGGFPCQPFSAAGKQKGRADDRDLWPEMFRIIREIRPTWVLGENVANFVNMELERTIIDLEGEGYEVQTFIIPACGVEAKHQRYRTFIVAYSNGGKQWAGTGFQQPTGDTAGKCIGDSSLVGKLGILANTNSQGLQGYRRLQECAGEWSSWEGGRPLERIWESEPNVGRVASRVPNRVDRLKSLGNAVVPQQIYPILAAIKQIDDMMRGG